MPDNNIPSFSSKIYVRLAPESIALFKFILEGYDNLAYLSVVDKYEAVGRLTFSPDQAPEVREFLHAAGEELDFKVLDLPFAGR